MTKVLIDDDGTGNQAFVESPTPALLTGAETSQGNFFRGDEDPADTPAYLAILAAGDIWVDTTGGAPFVHKERNALNNAWDNVRLVAKDAAGVLQAEARVYDNSGTFEVSLVANTPDAAGPKSTFTIDGNGTVTLQTSDAAGTPKATISISADVVEIQSEERWLRFGTDGLVLDQFGTPKPVGTQAAHVADATDEPSAVTQLNALLSAMRASGELAPVP